MWKLVIYGLLGLVVLGLAYQPAVINGNEETETKESMAIITLRVHEVSSAKEITAITKAFKKVAGVKEVTEKLKDGVKVVYFKVKAAENKCICADLKKAVGDKKLQILDPVHIVFECTACKCCCDGCPIKNEQQAEQLKEALGEIKGVLQVEATAGKKEVIIHQRKEDLLTNSLEKAKKVNCCCCSFASTLQSHELMLIDLPKENKKINIEKIKSDVEDIFGVAKFVSTEDKIIVMIEKGSGAKQTVETLLSKCGIDLVKKESSQKDQYVCPMGCVKPQAEPGRCSKCGMNLEKK